MRSFRLARPLVPITLSLTLLAGAPIAAQTPAPAAPETARPSGPSRPYRGLFGSASNPDSTHSLTLSGSLYGGYDTNVLADQAGVGVGVGSPQQGSSLAGGSLALAYYRQGRRVGFGGSVNTSTRYYPDEDQLTSGSYGAGLGFSALLSRYTRLSLGGSVAYQPFYQFSLFPGLEEPILGQGIPSNLDYVVSRESGWLYGSNISLDRQLGRRSSISAFYSLQKSDYDVTATTGRPAMELNSQYAGVRFVRTVTRSLGMRVGYAQRWGDFTEAGDVKNHEIDIGVDYNKTLAFSRRTSFSFSTGSSIMQIGGERHFRVVGTAGLQQAIGQSWRASIQYDRGFGFVGGFSEPLFSDNVSIGLGGLLGPRVSVSFNGGLSSGSIGEGNRDTSGFSTFSGTASIQYAFSALFGTFAQYNYFSYDFPLDPILPVAGRQGRHGVRGGLAVTLPLLR